MASAAAYHSAPTDIDEDLIEDREVERSASRVPKRTLVAGAGLLMLAATVAALSSSRSSVSSMVATRDIHATTELADAKVSCVNLPHIQISEVVSSNLGKQGPDKDKDEGLIFKGKDVGRGETGKEIFLEIHAKGDYTPENVGENGLSGKYMRINVKGGTEVDLSFQIKDKDGKALKLPHQDFTFFDLDATKKLEKEYIKVKHYTAYVTNKLTEVEVTEGNKFSASKTGVHTDNPEDPEILTVGQLKRAVMFSFEDVDSFEATLGAEGGHVRSFLFTGRPSLACAKIKDGEATLQAKDENGEEVKEVKKEEEEKKACMIAFLEKILGFCPIPSF